MKKLLASFAGGILTGLLFAAAPGPDVLKVDPKNHKVLVDNDKVRVMKVRSNPGDMTPLHSHPDSVVVFLTDEHTRFTLPDGKTSESKASAGDVRWAPAVTHSHVNLKNTPLELVLIELKQKN